MKKFMALLVAGAVVLGAAQVWAGGACCSSKKMMKKEARCEEHLGSLNLSDEQKAKIAEIKASCKDAGDAEEACEKARSQIREILTDDQRAKFDEACKEKGDWKKCGGDKE